MCLPEVTVLFSGGAGLGTQGSARTQSVSSQLLGRAASHPFCHLDLTPGEATTAGDTAGRGAAGAGPGAAESAGATAAECPRGGRAPGPPGTGKGRGYRAWAGVSAGYRVGVWFLPNQDAQGLVAGRNVGGIFSS